MQSAFVISIITISVELKGSKRMIQRQIEEMFMGAGYRFLQGRREEIRIYYRYYQEGFHAVIAVDQTRGYGMTPEQKLYMEEWVMSNFYHPQGVLSDFPEGFPVYRVEVLTLLIGGAEEQVRALCAACHNTWAYQPKEGRVIIYENQPGEFYGLRRMLEGIRTVAYTREQFSIPYVTIGMIVLNVLIFLVLEFLGNTYDAEFVAKYGGMYPTLVSEEHQWWRLLTAGFIHFGVSHLFNNMIILYAIGERLERSVGAIRMFVVYMVSLLGGSLCSYEMMLLTGDYAVLAGASGAVYGIIGGFLWLLLLHRGHLEGISARRLVFSILLMVYFGFSSSGIDNWAHIGGLVSGFLMTAILYHRKCQKY